LLNPLAKFEIFELTKVVFDKGAKDYHGRVEALANGAREAGLQF